MTKNKNFLNKINILNLHILYKKTGLWSLKPRLKIKKKIYFKIKKNKFNL